MERWKEEMEALVRELPGRAREIWGEAFREALLEVQGDRSKAAAMAWRAFKKPETEERRVAGGKIGGQGTLVVAVRGGTPEWVRVLGSDGLVLKEGRYPCCVDRRSLQAIAAHWEEGDRALRIAGTELGEEGLDSAVGWIQELRHRQDGLWIRVEWTEKALGDIWRKGPAYLGLNFILDEEQKPVALRQASLSCYPLINLWPSSHQAEKGGEEDLRLNGCQGRRLGQAGWQEEDESEWEAEVKKLVDGGGGWVELKESCRLSGEASPAEVRQAVEALACRQPGLAGLWSSEAETRPGEFLETAMEKRIAEAVAKGWIKPEQRDWAKVYAGRDWQGFNEFLDLAAGALGMHRKWPWRLLLFWRRFIR